MKAIRFSCNSWQLSINTTNIETKYPTKADAATRKPRQSPPEIHSAVILKSVQYDGGTQIGAISPKPDSKKPDFYLLFSDGISNFGRARVRGFEAPVYAVSDDSTTDHSLLRHLAVTTGGRYFNLKRMTDDEVLDGIGRSAFSFLSAKAGKAQAVDMYPEVPEPVSGGEKTTSVFWALGVS